MLSPRSKHVAVVTVSQASADQRDDVVAAEEPLEIRVCYCAADGARVDRALSITMRTPGDDHDLAAGFLLTEGVIGSRDAIVRVQHCGRDGDTVRIDLADGVAVDFARLERHVYTTSSCGVCGKTSLASVRTSSRFALDFACPLLHPAAIHAMPGALRSAQSVFDTTGGLHAAAIFDEGGTLLRVREDVGRHNAVDKVIGSFLLEGSLALSQYVLFVSGRASFELVQKAAMAGIPALAAVGAPSSLAVELAEECGMTLLGFVRNGRFNVYAGAQRLVLSGSARAVGAAHG